MSEVQATHGQSVIITRLSFITAFSWRWSEYLTIDTWTVRTDLASADWSSRKCRLSVCWFPQV